MLLLRYVASLNFIDSYKLYAHLFNLCCTENKQRWMRKEESNDDWKIGLSYVDGPFAVAAIHPFEYIQAMQNITGSAVTRHQLYKTGNNFRIIKGANV